MMRTLIRHGKKEYNRSPFKKERQLENFLKIILVIYIGGALSSSIISFPDFLENKYSVSKLDGKVLYILFIPLLDLLTRFFFQKIPKLNVRPYLALPIPKKTIVRSILWRSIRSFWFYLFMLGYIITIIFIWTMQLSTQQKINLSVYLVGSFFVVHFLNFSIKTGGKKAQNLFFGVYAILGGLVAFQKFGWIDIIPVSVRSSNWLSSNFILSIIPILLSIGLVYTILKKIPKQLSKSPESGIQEKTLPVQFFSRFGPIGKQIDYEIIMSLRLKAVKNLVLTSLIWIAYPLLINSTMGEDGSIVNFLNVIMGMFVSYGMVQYASYAFSWHTYHFNALQMNQKIQHILWGKYWFVIMIGLLSCILGTAFYSFIAKSFIPFIWSGFIYNIAITLFLSFYFSIKYAKPKNPYKSSPIYSNNQDFNFETMVLSVVYVLGIIVPYAIGLLIWNHQIGLLCIFIISLLFIAFNRYFIGLIQKLFQKNRYTIYNKFKQFEK